MDGVSILCTEAEAQKHAATIKRYWANRGRDVHVEVTRHDVMRNGIRCTSYGVKSNIGFRSKPAKIPVYAGDAAGKTFLGMDYHA